MPEREEIIRELNHLVRHYGQAAHEFFDDLQVELEERVGILSEGLKEGKGTLEEVRNMILVLPSIHSTLEKQMGDLEFLTTRMLKLLERPSPRSGGS